MMERLQRTEFYGSAGHSNLQLRANNTSLELPILAFSRIQVLPTIQQTHGMATVRQVSECCSNSTVQTSCQHHEV